jgi:hydrogenase maturation protease
MGLPDEVEIYDGATAGADLAYCLADRKRVIVIDCIHSDSAPGTVFRFTPDDVISQGGGRLSLHQIGLIDALRMAAQLGSAPDDVVIFGITPKELSYGLELSPEIAAVIPTIVELVLAELSEKR